MSDRTITLVGVDGTRHVLACSAEPYQLKPSAQLWGMAQRAINSRQVGQLPGERVESVRTLAKTIVVPIQVEANSELEVDTYLAALAPMLNPERGDVRLIYRRADATRRELTARYIGGGDATSATSVAGDQQRHVVVPLIFKAHYPYWRGPAGDYNRLFGTFDDGRSAGINSVTYWNGGDVDCWPEFLITGYAENIEAMNLTTGQVWRFLDILPLGSKLRIDHDPRSFGVWVDNAYAHTGVDPISEFWPLVPGDNHVIIRANTATGAETIGGWTIRFRFQYETP